MCVAAMGLQDDGTGINKQVWMHREKSWRRGAIVSPVHSRGLRASQWEV